MGRTEPQLAAVLWLDHQHAEVAAPLAPVLINLAHHDAYRCAVHVRKVAQVGPRVEEEAVREDRVRLKGKGVESQKARRMWVRQ